MNDDHAVKLKVKICFADGDHTIRRLSLLMKIYLP